MVKRKSPDERKPGSGTVRTPGNPATERPIHVFTPYYATGSSARQAELDECVRRNLGNPHIAHVFLMVDDGAVPPVASPSLTVIRVDARPSYRQWLQLTSVHAPNGLSLLCNSDIYFDETVDKLRGLAGRPRSVVALSRYDRVDGHLVRHPNPHWSQDSWAIDGSAELPEALLRELEIPLGVPRCDNKFAYVFAVHGWLLFNPVEDVRSVHVHETQQRSYDKRGDRTIVGAVGYVHPGAELTVPAEVTIDVWARRASAVRGVTLNRSLDAWDALQQADDGDASPDQWTPPPAEGPMQRRWRFQSEGRRVYAHRSRFSVYSLDGELAAFDSLMPGAVPLALPDGSDECPPIEVILAGFIPPVLDVRPIVIRDRPRSSEDPHFWQYPCTTERLAWERHRMLDFGTHVDSGGRTIHTYLGLPWATYIDKRWLPSRIRAYLQPRLSGLAELARAHGFYLRVHTVCQHIHWRRLAADLALMGVTDLHLSHCEKGLDEVSEGLGLRLHSWPLKAVNYLDPERAEGLVVGKPPEQKRYLASFIGAHMSHYRSDVRLSLAEIARADGGGDLLVEVGEEWHFNKVVYDHQIGNRSLDAAYMQRHRHDAERYNRVLSDSIFSLCPEGAGPNTLRVWESMAIGSIPVILSDNWVVPKLAGAPVALKDCFIHFPTRRLADLFPFLRSIERAQIEAMQRRCIARFEQVRQLLTFPDHAGV